MVVHVNPHQFSFRIDIRQYWQWFEDGLFLVLKQLEARAWQLPEGPLIESDKQALYGFIQLRQGEKLTVAQRRQNPAFHDLPTDFGFGLILRFSGTSGYDDYAIMGGHRLAIRLNSIISC